MFACCDESGIHAESRWWAFGVVWLPDDRHVPAFERDVTQSRQQNKCWGEFKWEKVTNRFLPAYQDFLDLALCLPDLHFTSMVVDTDEFTPDAMKQHHETGGKTEAYLKYMRLLISKRLPVMADKGHSEFTLLWDKQPGKAALKSTFREVLINDMANVPGGGCTWRHLSQANSAISHLLQLADMLTGATRYAWEPGKTSAQSDARDALRDQIEVWAGGSLRRTSLRTDNYYNLWRLRLGARQSVTSSDRV
jgi:hypothetical protein